MKHIAICLSLFTGAAGLSIPAATAGVTEVQYDLPTVGELIKKTEKAVGGREALDKVKTMQFSVQMEAGGQQLDLSATWSRKGGRLTTMTLPMGEMKMGTDGTTTWMHNDMEGYRIAPEMAKNQVRLAAMLMNMIDPSSMSKKELDGIKALGEEKFQDKACFKLEVPKSEGGGTTMMFLDKETGLPVGGQDPKNNVVMLFSDWKEVDGIKFFHKIDVTGQGPSGPETAIMTVSGIKLNSVGEEVFEIPAEVKKLVETKKAEAAAPEIKIEDLSASDQEEAKQFLTGLSAMDKDTLNQMVSGMEMGADHEPEAKKKLMKFYVQEIRKEIKKRG